MGNAASLRVLGSVEADQVILELLAHLQSDVVLVIHCVEGSDEGDAQFATTRLFAHSVGLFLQQNPIVLLVALEVGTREHVGLVLTVDVLVKERGSGKVLACLDLLHPDHQTIVLAVIGLLRGESKAELDVLIVGEILSVERETAVKLPHLIFSV